MDLAVLEHGDYRAAFAAVGGSLRSLTHRGRDLVRPWPVDVMRPAFRGAVLAPWPNRVWQGRWDWRGHEHRLPVTEPANDSALHGLLAWVEWQVDDVRRDAVTLRALLCAQPGYPFTVSVSVTWRLNATGLTGELTARNYSAEPAPFGAGFHPYLQAGEGRCVDDWRLLVPAAVRFETDERLQPAGEPVPPPSESDFRQLRTIGTAAVDHCYGQLDFVDGWCESTVVDARGDGAVLGCSTVTPWLQVHTSDHDPDPGHYRRAVALEPMTCPPGALASGRDLLVLEPGRSVTVPWSVRAA